MNKQELIEPQKQVMPKFFDDWANIVIAEHDKFYAISLIARAGWGYDVDYELGKSENPSTTRELLDWLVEDSRYLNKEKATEALLYGYEVEKEPKWIVKSNRLYFTSITQLTAREPITYNFTTDEKRAHVFDDKESAEKEASFFDGTVEKVEV